MSDQAVPSNLGNPDPTRGLPQVDAGDPLLDAFAYQHDLRERFLQALKDAKAEIERYEGIKVDVADLRDCLAATRRIIVEAIDSDKIEEWRRLGRPLPSLAGSVESQGRVIDSFIMDLAEKNEGEGRLWTVWGYDPQNDHWAPHDDDLALSEEEARDLAEQLGEDAPLGSEFIAIPVGEFPRPGDDENAI